MGKLIERLWQRDQGLERQSFAPYSSQTDQLEKKFQTLLASGFPVGACIDILTSMYIRR